jgi:Holliday junction resolvasome RuvABC ATP-dependent DNA helicase subunit
MRYVGQERIWRELNMILPEIRNEGRNTNFLFRAASGMGKTTMGLLCLNYLGINNSVYYLPLASGELPYPIDEGKRYHLIDEIHILKTPEILYPYMDSGRFTFFLMTNESGMLLEPLKNRCFQYIFSPYTDDEMGEIIRRALSGYSIPDEMVIEIRDRVRGNPRIAKKVCERLGYVFRNYLVPKTKAELVTILNNVLDIREKGLTEMDRRYLEFLSRVGKSSLQNIIYGTGIDRNTILTEIEPYLLVLGYISITQKGREICLKNNPQN